MGKGAAVILVLHGSVPLSSIRRVIVSIAKKAQAARSHEHACVFFFRYTLLRPHTGNHLLGEVHVLFDGYR